MNNFWDYTQFRDIEEKHRLTLDEGKTSIAVENLQDIQTCFKYESENPNQSFKDRGLAYQLSKHIQEGKRRFVISSSGNAAVSAAAYCSLAKVELDIFISERIGDEKYNRIMEFESSQIRVHKSKKPKSDAIQQANKSGVLNLRGSQDPYAVVGFKSIAYELNEEYPEVTSVFIPCSSGTSAMGIAEGFLELRRQVAIHVCQSTRIHPIAREFEQRVNKTETSLADAITDRVAKRKAQVIETVKRTGGGGWIITDDELVATKKFLDARNLPTISYNSLLSFAGILKAARSGVNLERPVAIMSGL